MTGTSSVMPIRIRIRIVEIAMNPKQVVKSMTGLAPVMLLTIAPLRGFAARVRI